MNARTPTSPIQDCIADLHVGDHRQQYAAAQIEAIVSGLPADQQVSALVDALAARFMDDDEADDWLAEQNARDFEDQLASEQR